VKGSSHETWTRKNENATFKSVKVQPSAKPKKKLGLWKGGGEGMSKIQPQKNHRAGEKKGGSYFSLKSMFFAVELIRGK